MKELKSDKFFQKVGVYGSVACLPVTIFIGPAIAFPAACVCLGLTATAVASDIERKRQRPSQEPISTSVAQILSEFERLNKGGQPLTPVVQEEAPSRFEEIEAIKTEIEDLSPLQFNRKAKKEEELKTKRDEMINEWTDLLEGYLIEDEEEEL